MMQEVEVLKTISELVCSYFSEEQFTLSKKYSVFTFEFCNSVEHWYPKYPSEGAFEQWKDGVDQYGNLCIIQHIENSKFSNMSPEAKKSTFKDMIGKGSIKFRIVSELTERNGDKVASLYWKSCLQRKKV